MPIFIPQKIKVGYQERKDTYTKKLAYVIYYDDKGVLRKETSWQNWRDKKIDALDCDNVPTSGFVLNKKVGGYCYHWDQRQTYVRIYDPRDFEFEITVENLLYILENTSAIKGKGLEGEFVYAWSGKDLVLMPTLSPDYKDLTEYRDMLYNAEYYGAAELIKGAIYTDKNGERMVYMGKYPYFTCYCGERRGKKFFFYNENGSFFTFSSISSRFIKRNETEMSDKYPDLCEKLEHNVEYSPIDETKTVYVPMTQEQFAAAIADNCGWHRTRYYTGNTSGEKALSVEYTHRDPGVYKVQIPSDDYWCRGQVVFESSDLSQIYRYVHPHYKDEYLANGNFHRRNIH